MELYTKNGYRFQIDEEDYERVSKIGWHGLTDKCGINYIRSHSKNSSGKKHILLHRFLLECPRDMQIDHVNRDGTDNRKANLRICTNSQNQANSIGKKQRISKYKGIAWYKNMGKWAARIRRNSKNVHLGYFQSEIEAAIAYNDAAIEMRKDFALLNEISNG